MVRSSVTVFYERLPTFCYHYGMIGHGTNSCSHRRGFVPSHEHGISHFGNGFGSDPRFPADKPIEMDEGHVGASFSTPALEEILTNEQYFSSWMVVSHLHSRGHGHGG